MRVLFVLFVVIPIVEMYVLIRVGAWLGAWPTIGLVLLTAVIGAALLRHEGINTLASVQRRLQFGELPARELIEGLFLAMGGALLLTPGFVTDVVGFTFLLPPTRKLLAAYLLRRGVFHVQGVGSHGADPGRTSRRGGDEGRIIEGEYSREEDDEPRR